MEPWGGLIWANQGQMLINICLCQMCRWKDCSSNISPSSSPSFEALSWRCLGGSPSPVTGQWRSKCWWTFPRWWSQRLDNIELSRPSSSSSPWTSITGSWPCLLLRSVKLRRYSKTQSQKSLQLQIQKFFIFETAPKTEYSRSWFLMFLLGWLGWWWNVN